MSEQRPLVLFHASCADGFCAAWVAHREMPDAEFIAVQYGEQPPDVTGREVLVLDFSFARPVLEKIARQAKSLVLLDHHKTAQADLEPICKELANIVRIPLSNGHFAFVDKEDAEVVEPYSWSEATRGGAVAYAGGGRENPKMISMHRLIMDAPDNILVDHKNRMNLDNRRMNLRFANRQQNAANMLRGSEFKGVRKHRNKWVAQISVNGTNNHLGLFDTPDLAAESYDKAAREYFGEFARCNFGDHGELFPANAIIRFDMSKSGGRMTWEHFYKDEPAPWLVRYTEDRDLWRWALPDSREINAALRVVDFDFNAWEHLFSHYPPPSFADRGRAILAAEAKTVKEHVKHAYETTIDGHDVLMVNATTLVSEIAGELAKGRPFGVCWFETEKNERVYSLRSAPDGADVSAIAKAHGGGGHKHAAGFSVPATGASGLFTEGQVDKHDEGEIKMGFAADKQNGIVRMDFGKPVAWLGFGPQQAREIGKMLDRKADEVEAG